MGPSEWIDHKMKVMIPIGPVTLIVQTGSPKVPNVFLERARKAPRVVPAIRQVSCGCGEVAKLHGRGGEQPALFGCQVHMETMLPDFLVAATPCLIPAARLEARMHVDELSYAMRLWVRHLGTESVPPT